MIAVTAGGQNLWAEWSSACILPLALRAVQLSSSFRSTRARFSGIWDTQGLVFPLFYVAMFSYHILGAKFLREIT
jgi:hypothetical protein